MAISELSDIRDVRDRASGILDTIETLLANIGIGDPITDAEAEQERIRQLILTLLLGTEEDAGLLQPLISTILLGDDKKENGLLYQAIQTVLLSGDKESGSLLDKAILTFLMGGKDGNGVIPRLDTLTTDMLTAQTNIQNNTKNVATLQSDVHSLQGDVGSMRSEIAAVKNRPCNCGTTLKAANDPSETQDSATALLNK